MVRHLNEKLGVQSLTIHNFGLINVTQNFKDLCIHNMTKVQIRWSNTLSAELQSQQTTKSEMHKITKYCKLIDASITD